MLLSLSRELLLEIFYFVLKLLNLSDEACLKLLLHLRILLNLLGELEQLLLKLFACLLAVPHKLHVLRHVLL